MRWSGVGKAFQVGGTAYAKMGMSRACESHVAGQRWGWGLRETGAEREGREGGSAESPIPGSAGTPS